LEWLLHRVDRHESNPFGLPPPTEIVAHQVALLLRRAHPILQSALVHRASNHARNVLLDMNQSLRELRRLLVDDLSENRVLDTLLDACIAEAETVNTCCEFDEVAQCCDSVFNALSSHLSSALGTPLPILADAHGLPDRQGTTRISTTPS
jgi:hypothetical protein